MRFAGRGVDGLVGDVVVARLSPMVGRQRASNASTQVAPIGASGDGLAPVEVLPPFVRGTEQRSAARPCRARSNHRTGAHIACRLCRPPSGASSVLPMPPSPSTAEITAAPGCFTHRVKRIELRFARHGTGRACRGGGSAGCFFAHRLQADGRRSRVCSRRVAEAAVQQRSARYGPPSAGQRAREAEGVVEVAAFGELRVEALHEAEPR